METASGEVRFGNGGTGILELPDALAKGARPPVVLVIHGRTGNRSEGGRFDRASAALRAAGLAVLRIDTPQGTIGERLEVARTALAHLAQRPDVDPARIGVLGYSWGGLIAAYLVDQGNSPLRAAVFWNPVDTENGLPDGPTQMAQRGGVLRIVTGGEPCRNDSPDQARAARYGAASVIHVGGGHTFRRRDAAGNVEITDPAATAHTVEWFTEML